MSFGDIPTTTATSGMEPFGILFEGFQPLALADTALAVGIISWRSPGVKKCYRGIFFERCGSPRSTPGFYILCDSVIVTPHFILILSSLAGWCQGVLTGVIYWAELWPKCNVVHHYANYNFFLIFTVEWICKWSSS